MLGAEQTTRRGGRSSPIHTSTDKVSGDHQFRNSSLYSGISDVLGGASRGSPCVRQPGTTRSPRHQPRYAPHQLRSSRNEAPGAGGTPKHAVNPEYSPTADALGARRRSALLDDGRRPAFAVLDDLEGAATLPTVRHGGDGCTAGGGRRLNLNHAGRPRGHRRGALEAVDRFHV